MGFPVYRLVFFLAIVTAFGCKRRSSSGIKEEPTNGPINTKTLEHGNFDTYKNGGTDVHRMEPHEKHWGYAAQEEKEEVIPPTEWGLQYSTCAEGRRQSPVSFIKNDQIVKNAESRPGLEFAWPAKASDFSVVNNRHTVQATVTQRTAKHQVSFRGTTYQLRQFHYHKLSEHTVDQRPYDLEIHFVHEDKDGNFLVIGVLANFTNDPQSNFTMEIAKLGLLPKRSDEDRYIAKDLPLMPLQLLPRNGNYDPQSASLDYKGPFFTYLGSLTTPPCTERVTWVVLLDPVAVTKADIETIREARFANPFENARPTVPASRTDHKLEWFDAAM